MPLLAIALPPQLNGLDDGHEDFLRAGGVHLLTDDVLDLAHGAQGHREVGIDTRGDLRDETGADEEAMPRCVSIGRVIPQSLAEHLGHTHRSMVARGTDGEKSGAGRGTTGFGGRANRWFILLSRAIFPCDERPNRPLLSNR